MVSPPGSAPGTAALSAISLLEVAMGGPRSSGLRNSEAHPPGIMGARRGNLNPIFFRTAGNETTNETNDTNQERRIGVESVTTLARSRRFASFAVFVVVFR